MKTKENRNRHLIWNYSRETLRKYPKLFVQAIGLSLVITILNLLIPLGMRQFMEQAAGGEAVWLIVAGVAGFALLMLVNTLVEIQWYVMLDRLGGARIQDLTLELERALAETSMGTIEEERPEVVKHILYADVLDVFRVIGHHIPSLIGAVATILFGLGLSFCYHVPIAVFLTATAILGFYLSFASRNMIASRAGKTNIRLKAHHALTDQYVNALALVQTNPIRGYFEEKTEQSIGDFIRTSQKEDWVSVFFTRLVSDYNMLVTIAISAILVFFSSEGTAENLVFFTMLAGLIASKSQGAELLLQQIMKAEASFQNVDRIRRLSPRQGEETLAAIREIRFVDVDFSYEKRKPGNREGDAVHDLHGKKVLDGVCCTLRRGECVRLAGGNGSGKSTFLKLLMGSYAPQSGTVLLNGRPVSVYSRESLNRQILYVSQEERFLNELAEVYLEQICGQKPDLKKLRIWAAQLGLETSASGDLLKREIEGEGNSLSVGQRKKLLILKMLIRQSEASVIILDELQAGLDQHTRAVFGRYLDELLQTGDKIVLMIEHDAEAAGTCGRTLTFPL